MLLGSVLEHVIWLMDTIRVDCLLTRSSVELELI